MRRKGTASSRGSMKLLTKHEPEADRSGASETSVDFAGGVCYTLTCCELTALRAASVIR